MPRTRPIAIQLGAPSPRPSFAERDGLVRSVETDKAQVAQVRLDEEVSGAEEGEVAIYVAGREQAVEVVVDFEEGTQ